MRRTMMMGIMVAILVGVTTPGPAQQVYGRRKLDDNHMRKYWGEVLIRCGDRVFIAENYGLFVMITEYRGNVSFAGEEFILDKAWLAANHIEAKGTLFIRFTESRICHFNKDHPEKSTTWSNWMKPMIGNGAAFPYTRAAGKLVVSAGVVERTDCDTIAFMDNFQRK